MKSSTDYTICFPFVGDSIGGSVISTIIVVEELKNIEELSLRVILHQEGPLAEWLRKRGIDYQVKSDLPYYSGSESKLIKLVKLYAIRRSIGKFVRNSGIDIVHTNDARIHITWSVGVYRARCRHIWHQRTRWSKSLLGKLLLTRAETVVAISRYVKSGLLQETGVDPIVIPNPVRIRLVSVNRVTAKQKRLLLTKEDAKHTWIVGYVGSYKEQKRPLDFINIAASFCLDEAPKIRWIMIGKDEDYSRQEIEEIARQKNVVSKLSVFPFQENIEEWYNAIDILIAPSEGEAFGRNIIEAMNSKVIVIAAKSGGHKELINDGANGFLVDVGNILEYKSVIKRLTEGKIPHDKIRQNASTSLVQLYEVESVVNQLLTIYNK